MRWVVMDIDNCFKPCQNDIFHKMNNSLNTVECKMCFVFATKFEHVINDYNMLDLSDIRAQVLRTFQCHPNLNITINMHSAVGYSGHIRINISHTYSDLRCSSYN